MLEIFLKVSQRRMQLYLEKVGLPKRLVFVLTKVDCDLQMCRLCTSTAVYFLHLPLRTINAVLPMESYLCSGHLVAQLLSLSNHTASRIAGISDRNRAYMSSCNFRIATWAVH